MRFAMQCVERRDIAEEITAGAFLRLHKSWKTICGDDYAEAAVRLETLVPKYPDRAEPLYYLGVCRLFLNRNEAAIGLLRTARVRDGGALADDISWYLAAACDRAGRSAEARRVAEGLCRGSSEYKARACAAAARLTAR